MSHKKTIPNTQVSLNQKELIFLSLSGGQEEGGVALEAAKWETLNTRDKYLLLDVKSWLENLLYDHGQCKVRLQSYVQNAHFPSLDI